ELMDEQGGGDRKRRAGLLWLLGNNDFVSSGPQAVEYLEAAAPLFEELGDDQAACDVHMRLTVYLGTDQVRKMDMRRAMPHFKKAEALLAKQSESWRHALFHINMASTCCSTRRISDGLAAAKRAMEISERLDQPFLREALWSTAAVLTSNLLVYSGS